MTHRISGDAGCMVCVAIIMLSILILAVTTTAKSDRLECARLMRGALTPFDTVVVRALRPTSSDCGHVLDAVAR